MFLKWHHIFSRILKNYERSEKSDTVLLDEIKERVLREDFDRTLGCIHYVSCMGGGGGGGGGAEDFRGGSQIFRAKKGGI